MSWKTPSWPRLERLGYTPREASFLALAALHSGYFLMRQFASDGGKSADRFCKKLVCFRHAGVTRCANNTFLFHVRAKAIYRSLDQEDNRHRRAHNPYHVRAKVMGLDYVLKHAGHRFLATEEEKISYFAEERNLPRSCFPTKTYVGKAGHTERFFIDKYPIRIDPETGKVAFCFIDDGAFGGLGFPTWLSQYHAIIRALGSAEVIYVSPDRFTFPAASQQFREHFEAPGSIPSEDLTAYFALRKEIEALGLRGRSQAALNLWKRLRKTFKGQPFEAAYADWLGGGIQASQALPVTLETHQLAHSYRFFGVKA